MKDIFYIVAGLVTVAVFVTTMFVAFIAERGSAGRIKK
jgi:hypothetical protein